ncbi:hypothetical protein GLOIN_2v1790377 [Rhizophagus clarus]|uniref:Uncharacterized protein n=1 Tax=Rhizophagus clarus TaxID=94130 RepID=A0A8H3L0P1_9GLOM|nr:hypothetical protein GLOIN_2v1790377 [Rhizophagus clarus]
MLVFMMSDYLRLAMIMPQVTLDSYDELQKCLEEEMKILPKKYLLTNWYITEDKVSNEQEPEENEELLLSFMDIGQKSALIYSQMGWYELATYTMEKAMASFPKYIFILVTSVTIHEEDSGECYAIIKGIFKYKGNDDKYYAFITIDWF